jgi:hypothetical protein
MKGSLRDDFVRLKAIEDVNKERNSKHFQCAVDDAFKIDQFFLLAFRLLLMTILAQQKSAHLPLITCRRCFFVVHKLFIF